MRSSLAIAIQVASVFDASTTSSEERMETTTVNCVHLALNFQKVIEKLNGKGDRRGNLSSKSARTGAP